MHIEDCNYVCYEEICYLQIETEGLVFHNKLISDTCDSEKHAKRQRAWGSGGHEVYLFFFQKSKRFFLDAQKFC